MTKKINFSDEQKSDIFKKYVSDKETIDKIALGYGLSVTPIKSVLRGLNVIFRKPNETIRKYSINETYFDSINSEDRAYFLGYLMADGYNNEKRGVIEISSAAKDKDLLGKLSSAIGSTRSLRFVKDKDGNISYRTYFCSKHISQQLAHLGCMQAKTFKLKFPTYLREDLVRHFVRGYFDGDGCLSYTFAKRDNVFGNSFLSVVTITSTDDFCLYLSHYIKNNLDINSTLLCRHPENNNNNRTLQVSGNDQVIKLMDWMYANTCLYLKRKHDKLLFIKETLKQRDSVVRKVRSENGRKVINDINRKDKLCPQRPK